MILEVKKINKNFGGLKALSDITFSMGEEEIVGLIGPNGAGKTTLFNVITGVFPPDQGEIIFRGHNTTRVTPDKACKLGLGRTFQITKPFLNLTVLQAITIGALNRACSVREAVAKAEETLEYVGLKAYRNSLGSTLNVAQRKKMELARALATDPKLLLLDEVVAGLNPTEVNQMIQLIRQISQRGIGLIIVEHILRVVMSLSQRVIVLHHGEIIANKSPDELMKDERVLEVYLGEVEHYA